MSEAERDKWQEMYASGRYRARSEPGDLVQRWLSVLPRGRALDVACGTGRHALFLAENGYRVDAVDIAAAALARGRESAAQRGLDIAWQCADLDDYRPADGAYQLIAVMRFVNRLLMPRLAAALAPGGWLLFEHHLRTGLQVNGPRDPAFRLAPNELLQAFPTLRVIEYHEQLITETDGMRMVVARLAACNGDAGL